MYAMYGLLSEEEMWYQIGTQFGVTELVPSTANRERIPLGVSGVVP